jgi:hypothetical protein
MVKHGYNCLIKNMAKPFGLITFAPIIYSKTLKNDKHS